MSILRDQSSGLAPRHAGLATLLGLAVIAVGVLFGLGAVDLYETANGWVLQT